MKRRTKVVAYAYIALHLAGGVASIFTPPSWRRPGIPAVVPEDLSVALPVAAVFAIVWVLLLWRKRWAWWALTITSGGAMLLVVFGTLSVDNIGMSPLWWVLLFAVNSLFVTGLALWIVEIPPHDTGVVFHCHTADNDEHHLSHPAVGTPHRQAVEMENLRMKDIAYPGVETLEQYDAEPRTPGPQGPG